ncbi:MAG: heterodisulfide reductase subunit F [candidate division Zixibacteria bacterium 4484_93]|nr:MAG: heterodisulfide reductase subunit F [candidate division Zixibacteria bacterium 4484_93]
MNSENPYLPLSSELVDLWFETDDRQIKSFVVELPDSKRFDYKPGQFCQLSLLGVGEAPFGIASSPDEKHLLFTVNRIGTLTSALHELEKGTEIGIRGPLGNWYPVEKMKGHSVVIVGGGYAFTTLRSLFLYIASPKRRGDYNDITIVYGAREPGLLLYRDEFDRWSKREDVSVELTIDKAYEGWTRHIGFVPAVLEKVAPSSKGAYAVVCGPPIMIKFTLPVLEKLGFPPERIYTSLEMRMKCGIGKCGRCNIGEKYICYDGPVFSFEELKGLNADF